jgi:hypothetical protein
MTLATLLLGFIISTLYGAVFHLWRDGGFGRLLLYLFSSWLGFWAGHLLSKFLGLSFWNIGPLHLGMATIGSCILLLLGYWLGLVDSSKIKK